MSGHRALAFVSLFALVAGCTSSTAPSTGGGGGGGTCSGSSAAVAVCDNHYSPATSTITAGTSITWTWKGSNQHSVTFLTGPVALGGSGTMVSGTFTQNFATAGTYTYECSVHGAAMSGTVTVN